MVIPSLPRVATVVFNHGISVNKVNSKRKVDEMCFTCQLESMGLIPLSLTWVSHWCNSAEFNGITADLYWCQ